MSNEPSNDLRRKRGERNILIKSRIATVADRVGIWSLMHRTAVWRSHKFIRAVNYHGTPSSSSVAFERQLEFFRENYVSCDVDDVFSLLNGHWTRSKPGLIISFDDAMANNAEVAAPLLEKYGFVGWFLIPPRFVCEEPSLQGGYAAAWEIDVRITNEVHPIRAMTWDQVRTLDRSGHVIGSHTLSHRRLQEHLSDEVLSQEIVESKRVLAEQLGHPIDVFSWVGGRQEDYSRRAALKIKEAGYRISLMTNSQAITANTNPLQIQRTHLEAAWDMSLVRLQLSGAIDRLYRKKRNIVEERTRTDSSSI